MSANVGVLMSGLKTNLINGYRLATTPIRQFNLWRMKKSGTVPISILFYHRVDNETPNPWTISESGFVEQINWFQEHFDLVSLEECQQRMQSGFNDRPTLSITFDDGYADNSTFAIPMLIERKIPFTYFVTTHHTKSGQPFPHDVELGQPLSPNSIDTLKSMANAGVEIGGHTRTHADLGKLSDPAELYDEVIKATQEMEDLIGKKIRYFAFPFGQVENLNPVVFHLLKDAGFRGVCSAYGGMNAIGDDPFHLQRMHGDSNFARMKNWLTFDPRIKSEKSYLYEEMPVAPESKPINFPGVTLPTDATVPHSVN